MGKPSNRSSAGPIAPSRQEDAAIDRGIAADPDAMELTAERAKRLQPMRRRGLVAADKQFTLTSVTAQAGGMLLLTFADGAVMRVDVAPIVQRSPVLRPLNDPTVFRRARLGEWGGCVTWDDDVLELAADNLRACAVEQACGQP